MSNSEDSFSTAVWQWYGQDEHQRILAICLAIRGLEFLAMTADEMRQAIPYCPACEAWSETILPVSDAIEAGKIAFAPQVSAALQTVWRLCNDLCEDAFHCNDWLIFDHPEWESVRKASKQALMLMDAATLQPFLEELAQDCRNAIRGF